MLFYRVIFTHLIVTRPQILMFYI